MKTKKFIKCPKCDYSDWRALFNGLKWYCIKCLHVISNKEREVLIEEKDEN